MCACVLSTCGILSVTVVCIVIESVQVVGLCCGIVVEYCDSSVSKYYDDT